MMFPRTIEIPEEKYRELKAILDQQHGKEFTIEDVKEIANELVDLYFLLEYLEYKEHSTGS